MQQLAGVFLHVNAPDANIIYFPAGGERAIELRDLISLRKVGIEIVFAREDRSLVNFALRRECHPNRELDRFSIEHRQRAGIAEADRADLRVGRSAERGGAAAEDLRLRLQASVNFESDDGRPRHAAELSRRIESPRTQSCPEHLFIARGKSRRSFWPSRSPSGRSPNIRCAKSASRHFSRCSCSARRFFASTPTNHRSRSKRRSSSARSSSFTSPRWRCSRHSSDSDCMRSTRASRKNS